MKKLLIIGNGFDIDLGLKTSYTDFLSSPVFVGLANSGNQLAWYLKRLHELRSQEQLWVDIEHELMQYTRIINNYIGNVSNPFVFELIQNHINGDDKISSVGDFVASPILRKRYSGERLTNYFNNAKVNLKTWFVELKNCLSEYLTLQVNDFKPRESLAFHLLRTADFIAYPPAANTAPSEDDYKPFSQVFSFNYTNALRLIQFDMFSPAASTQIHNVHGSLSEKNIVFGVEDGSVASEFSFLNKSAHSAFGLAPDISSAILAADEVHFFGCSLGNTDDAHFKHPFKELSQRRRKEQKTKIFFYVYGHGSYNNIYKGAVVD